MSAFRKLNTFIKLPFSTKALFVEALITSAWVKISLSFFPFRKVIGWLGSAQEESAKDEDSKTFATRKQIAQVLNLCNRYTFWTTECYTISLTGKLLLRRRKINSTLYIGFIKNEDGIYKGHAWLRANNTYIYGYRESLSFEIHSMFS